MQPLTVPPSSSAAIISPPPLSGTASSLTNGRATGLNTRPTVAAPMPSAGWKTPAPSNHSPGWRKPTSSTSAASSSCALHPITINSASVPPLPKVFPRPKSANTAPIFLRSTLHTASVTSSSTRSSPTGPRPEITAPQPSPRKIGEAVSEPHLKILILSPHRDDAAFSLSIAITNWLVARHNVTIFNVFTRSRYAPYSDAGFVHENDQISYVSAMRLREDELFVRRITEILPKGLKNNLHMVDLNLKDAPIRLRIPLEELSDT